MLCGLGMQHCAMHNATVQKTTFFELGVYRSLSWKSWNNLIIKERALSSQMIFGVLHDPV